MEPALEVAPQAALDFGTPPKSAPVPRAAPVQPPQRVSDRSAVLLNSIQRTCEQHFGSLQKAFLHIDSDRSGFISAQELIYLLYAHNVQVCRMLAPQRQVVHRTQCPTVFPCAGTRVVENWLVRGEEVVRAPGKGGGPGKGARTNPLPARKPTFPTPRASGMVRVVPKWGHDHGGIISRLPTSHNF